MKTYLLSLFPLNDHWALVRCTCMPLCDDAVPLDASLLLSRSEFVGKAEVSSFGRELARISLRLEEGEIVHIQIGVTDAKALGFHLQSN